MDYNKINSELKKITCPICQVHPLNISVNEKGVFGEIPCMHSEMEHLINTEIIRLKKLQG